MNARFKVYEGSPSTDGPGQVTIVTPTHLGSATRAPLPPRNDLYNHSPDGFAWGYGGSGPGQLALAMLADALIPDVQLFPDDVNHADAAALLAHQDFKWDYVAKWKQDMPFAIVADEVRRWFNEWQNANGKAPS